MKNHKMTGDPSVSYENLYRETVAKLAESERQRMELENQLKEVQENLLKEKDDRIERLEAELVEKNQLVLSLQTQIFNLKTKLQKSEKETNDLQKKTNELEKKVARLEKRNLEQEKKNQRKREAAHGVLIGAEAYCRSLTLLRWSILGKPKTFDEKTQQPFDYPSLSVLLSKTRDNEQWKTIIAWFSCPDITAFEEFVLEVEGKLRDPRTTQAHPWETLSGQPLPDPQSALSIISTAYVDSRIQTCANNLLSGLDHCSRRFSIAFGAPLPDPCR